MKRLVRRYWYLLVCCGLLLGATGGAATRGFEAAPARADFAVLKGALCSAATTGRSAVRNAVLKSTPRKSTSSRWLASAQASEEPDVTPVCGVQPTQYHRLQEAASNGDLTVDLQVLMNQVTPPGFAGPLCYVYNDVPEAPVMRIRRGHRLTVNLTNGIDNQDSDYNCPIDTFADGGACVPPVVQPVGTPGADGPFYPIQSNVRHAATGITNLHVHGLNVSPHTCHDEVVHTKIYPENFADDPNDLPSCQPAANEFDYTYDIPNDEPPGLYWYHSHSHGEAQAQVMMGLTGAIVIEDEEDDRRRAQGVGDDVLIVRDYPAPQKPRPPAGHAAAPAFHPARNAAAGAGLAQSGNHAGAGIDPRVDLANEAVCQPGDPKEGGPEKTYLTLNGAQVPEDNGGPLPDAALLHLQMRTGERRLWRLLNASANTYIAPSLIEVRGGVATKLPLVIVARDGVPVAADGGARQLSTHAPKTPLLMAPGNRLEFLVHAPAPGAKLYLDSEQVIVGCAGDGTPHRHLLLVTSSGAGPAIATPADDRDIAPHSVNTKFTGILAAKPTVFRTLAFTEFPRPFATALTQWSPAPPTQLDEGAQDFYLTQTAASDGSAAPVALIPYQMDGSTPNITVHLNGQSQVTEEWTLQNYTNEVHAFHIHQIHFRVMTDVADGQPLMDVINVPAAVQERNGDPGAPGQVTIRLTFTSELAGEFVYHCHILEHEDNGMMGKILVSLD